MLSTLENTEKKELLKKAVETLPLDIVTKRGVTRATLSLSVIDANNFLTNPKTISLIVKNSKLSIESSFDTAIKLHAAPIYPLSNGEDIRDLEAYINYIVVAVATAASLDSRSIFYAYKNVKYKKPQLSPSQLRPNDLWTIDEVGHIILDYLIHSVESVIDKRALKIAKKHPAGSKLYNLIAGQVELVELLETFPPSGWLLTNDNIGVVQSGIKLKEIIARLVSRWAVDSLDKFSNTAEGK